MSSRVFVLALLSLLPALHAHGDEEELEASVLLLQGRAALQRLSALEGSGSIEGLDPPGQEKNASRALGMSDRRRVIAERVKAHALEAAQMLQNPNASMEAVGNRKFFHFTGDPTIDLSLEYQILHFGKTGGSTLKEELKRMANYSRAEMLDHVPSGETLHSCTQRQSKYVFFVRAPVSRYISGFISRLNYGNPDSKDYSPVLAWSPSEKAAYETFSTPDALGCALNSSNLTLRAAAMDAIDSIFHTSHDLNWYWKGLENLKACIDQVFFVGRQEHYDEDLAALVAKLDANSVLTNNDFDTGVVRGTSEAYDSMRDVGACAIRNLREYYRRDYEIIDYLAAAGKLPASYPAEVRSVDVPTKE